MVDLYSGMQGRGLEILGFPCNQFGVISGQESGCSATIRTFVNKFGVKFPMMEKIDVNKDNTHPVYQLLKGEGGKKIGWNFGAYFLITPGPSGEAVTISRYENSPDELQAILSAACDELSAAPAEAAEPAEAAAPAGSSL